MTANIVRTSGVLSLYNGLSAAVLRQATYSTMRFGCYETVKNLITKRSSNPSGDMAFSQKIFIAGFSGFAGGFFGTPADLVNVRMQNDSKLAPEMRRNYKNCIDALLRIARTEGVTSMFSGVTMASLRGMGVTIGQLAFYDEFKYQLIKTGYFEDNLATHFTASIGAGVTATVITMPLDVCFFFFFFFVLILLFCIFCQISVLTNS